MQVHNFSCLSYSGITTIKATTMPSSHVPVLMILPLRAWHPTCCRNSPPSSLGGALHRLQQTLVEKYSRAWLAFPTIKGVVTRWLLRTCVSLSRSSSTGP